MYLLNKIDCPFVCQNHPFVGRDAGVELPIVGNKNPFVGKASQDGFTLVELIIVITIVGILAAFAAPSLTTFFRANRLTSHVNDVIGDVTFARSEAIKRGVNVTICPGTASAGCTGTWSSSRIVFVDTDADFTLDSGETVLRAREAPDKATVSIEYKKTAAGGGTTASATYFGFASSAITANPAAVTNLDYYSVKVCVSGYSKGKEVRVNAYGRVVTQKTEISC